VKEGTQGTKKVEAYEPDPRAVASAQPVNYVGLNKSIQNKDKFSKS